MRGPAKLIEVTDSCWIWQVLDDFGAPMAQEIHGVGGIPQDCYPLDFNGLVQPEPTDGAA